MAQSRLAGSMVARSWPMLAPNTGLILA